MAQALLAPAECSPFPTPTDAMLARAPYDPLERAPIAGLAAATRRIHGLPDTDDPAALRGAILLDNVAAATRFGHNDAYRFEDGDEWVPAEDVEAVRQQARDRVQPIIDLLRTEVPKEKWLIVGPYILALEAHAGQPRLIGGDYVDHPIQCAAMTFFGMDVLGVEPAVRDFRSGQALTHDATEDTVGDRFNDTDSPNRVVPLAIEYLYRGMGLPEGLARKASDVQRRVSRIPHPELGLTYSDYIEVVADDFESAIVKLADPIHNRVIQPKPNVYNEVTQREEWEAEEAKINGKNSLYDGASWILPERAAFLATGTPDADLALEYGRVLRSLTPDQVQNELTPAFLDYVHSAVA